MQHDEGGPQQRPVGHRPAQDGGDITAWASTMLMTKPRKIVCTTTSWAAGVVVTPAMAHATPATASHA